MISAEWPHRSFHREIAPELFSTLKAVAVVPTDMSVGGGTKPPNARGRNGGPAAITPLKWSGRCNVARKPPARSHVVVGDYRLFDTESVEQTHYDVADIMELLLSVCASWRSQVCEDHH
jgi:hypothetical protein